MVALALIILQLYPQAVSLLDFIVSDDGSGPRITYWDEAKLGPQPTGEQLAAVVIPPDPQIARAGIAAAYAALPLATRVEFFAAYNDINSALNLGHWDIAIAILQALTVPDELAATKAGFLAQLQAAEPVS